MNRWIRFGNTIESVVNFVAALLAALMTFVVVWQVFARYVLNTGQFWAEEFAIICMFWLALLGAAGALWTGDHIGLRVVVERLPKPLQEAAQIVSELVIGVFAILLTFQGLELVARTSGGNWSALRVPLGYTYVVLPISAALMAILSLMKATLRTVALLGGGEIPSSWAVHREEE